MTDQPQPASAAVPSSAVGEQAVQVVTRDTCHLCDDALVTVERLAAEFDVDWGRVRLEELPEGPERDRWTVEVPVLLVDGVQRDFWQIDPRRVSRLLRERRG